MLRAILWIATVWLILIIFTGCASQEKQALHDTHDARWARNKVKPVELVDADEARNPKINSATYYAAALLLESQGNYRAAIEKYLKAIETDSSSIAAYNRLAMLYLKLKKYELAEDKLKEAIMLHPQSASLHNNLGFTYLLEHRYKDAEAELRNALSVNRNYVKAHINLAIALAQQDKYNQSLNHFLVGCSAAEANYNLALLLHSQGKYKLAKKYYKQALELDPNFAPALKALKLLSKSQ